MALSETIIPAKAFCLRKPSFVKINSILVRYQQASTMSTPPTMPERSRCVTVFGGSGHRVGTPIWDEDIAVGKVIANKGFAVVNGGYMGSMEATAIGAKAVGGSSFGIVVPSLFLQRHKMGGANSSLTGVIDTPSLISRIEKLVSSSATFVVLPGSLGTLQELVTVWNEAHLSRSNNSTPPRIFVWRDPWEKIMQNLMETLAVEPEILHFVTFVDGVADLERLL
ncbi:DNA-binding protein [Pelomyxa schiedti]|nr:DNA-binding protein [Pelomyxa schiedti]